MSGLNISRRCAMVAAAWLAAGPALAAERSMADVATWVATNTDIAPAQIAIVASEYVYGFEALGPMTATGEVIALVRTEAFAVKAGAARAVQSWEAHLLFDCRGGRMRLIRSADYRERNRGGSPIATEETAGWQSPSAGEPASQLLAAACDPAFTWPLRAYAPHLAAARDPIPPTLPIVVSNQTAAPPESAPPEATPAAHAIQIARGPSSEGARRALKLARKTLGAQGANLEATTEHSRLGARHRFTAVLSGFPTEAAATGACATLRAAEQACFVRAAPAALGSPAG